MELLLWVVGWGTAALFAGQVPPDTGALHATVSRGSMSGAISDPFDEGGLGLSGVGEAGGGGAPGAGHALDELDRLGRGDGIGEGMGDWALTRVAGAHRSKVPVLSADAAAFPGRLAPAVIQRVMRPSIGLLRGCYEAAHGTQPGLQGRVTVRFVIDRSGSVASAVASESTLPSSVSRCVARVVASLSFPEPEGGSSVSVTYPITFSPD